MTQSRRRPTLRTLDAAQLQSVSGGIIIYAPSASSGVTVPSGISQALNFSVTP
jgi:hypothetical protein